MVCLGNICRSPLAEGIMQEKARQAGLNWVVDSAGTYKNHVGEAPHALSQKVASMNGIDISRQRSRHLQASDIEQFDMIYAMAADVMEGIRSIYGAPLPEGKVQLFLEELYPGENRDVPDPWYGPEPGYHEVFQMIEQTCDAIIAKHLTLQP